MIAWALMGAALCVAALSEVRLRRTRRAERLVAIQALCKQAGIGPALTVARNLGWVGEEDIRSDGDVVQFRLAKRSWRRRS